MNKTARWQLQYQNDGELEAIEWCSCCACCARVLALVQTGGLTGRGTRELFDQSRPAWFSLNFHFKLDLFSMESYDISLLMGNV
jgi:hypothetical protein